MKKVFSILVSLAFVLTLTSCSGVREGIKADLGIGNNADRPKKEKVVKEKKVKAGAGRENQKNPDDIKVYRSKKPDRQYEEMESVFANKYNMGFPVSITKIEQKFKNRAAELEGDAVIMTGTDAIGVTGVVIKFTDKISETPSAAPITPTKAGNK